MPRKKAHPRRLALAFVFPLVFSFVPALAIHLIAIGPVPLVVLCECTAIGQGLLLFPPTLYLSASMVILSQEHFVRGKGLRACVFLSCTSLSFYAYLSLPLSTLTFLLGIPFL